MSEHEGERDQPLRRPEADDAETSPSHGNRQGQPPHGDPARYGQPASGDTAPFGQPASGDTAPFGQPASGDTAQYGQPAYGSAPQGYSQPEPGRPAYGDAPQGYDPPGYGQPTQAYGQAPYGQPAYGNPPYGQHPGYGTAPYPGEAGMYREPSQAVLALVVALVGLVAFQIISPVAWVLANREIEGIDQGRRNPANRGMAVAAKVCGIIGTVLLIVGVLIMVIVLVGLFAVSSSSQS